MLLRWHSYKYYPYERELAQREVAALLGTSAFEVEEDGIRVHSAVDPAKAFALTYFASVEHAEGNSATRQDMVEATVRAGAKRQATRYSVHGIHEYKGKFNPQVAKALLNILGVTAGSNVLDPFCGSGTTLVEAAQLGAKGIGTDINPLAVYLANAKLAALSIPAEELSRDLSLIEESLRCTKTPVSPDGGRERYLRAWFDEDIFNAIELLKTVIEAQTSNHAPVFLTVASNVLRDYSQQEPSDLRIRRRKSPLPAVPFERRFIEDARELIRRVSFAQKVCGLPDGHGRALRGSITNPETLPGDVTFDAAVTSPPYAMALPYIDTQRLSLVWLGMADSNELGPLESRLIGSREMAVRTKREMNEVVGDNSFGLPDKEAKLCAKLANALSVQDGFRRQAVPALLYRYFQGMQAAFASIRPSMRSGAKFALIVGHNHTTLGGQRFDIDTPLHLASLATSVGWELDELLPLQTYQRFGLHMNNAVASETLILLSAR